MSWSSSSLTSLLRRPGLGLGLELVQSLFGGVSHHRLLAMELLLGEVVHYLPHACLTPHADHAEALALAIGSVFVELDLEEVSDPEILDIVLYVLVCCPPGQIPDVQLPLSSVLTPA